VLHLLPALPAAWPEGSVTGLKARGGFEVDVAWAGGKLTRAVIRSRLGGNVRLRTAGPVALESVTAKPAAGANPNPFYRIVEAGKPIVAPGGALPPLPSRAAVTVDFPTTAGGTYVVGSR
jgi:alpha-L-fucosidase 2